MFSYANIRQSFTAAACLLTALSCAAAETEGPSYVYFQVAGAVRTIPVSINDAMSVTGYWIDNAGSSHGFVRDGLGKITSFDPAGSISTQSIAINALGEIAGFYSDVNGASQGFVRSPNGSITTFNAGGGSDLTYVSGLNDRGEVLGSYATSIYAQTLTPFVREPNGAITVLHLPQTLNATPSAINDLGEITGGYSLSGGTQSGGFVRSPGGTITTFTEEQGTAPIAINIAGLVAGTVATGTPQGDDGFVRYPDGTIAPFALPGSVQGSYMGINSEGVITGSYLVVQTVAPMYQTHSFLRFPSGNIVTFDAPGAVGLTEATSVNDFNVVTGVIQSRTPLSAFLRLPEKCLQ